MWKLLAGPPARSSWQVILAPALWQLSWQIFLHAPGISSWQLLGQLLKTNSDISEFRKTNY